jgi:hypothetical protein
MVIDRMKLIPVLFAVACASNTGRAPNDLGAGVLPPTDGVDLLSSSSPDLKPSVCGDDVCSPGESCKLCPNDCGECPKCNASPSCSDGAAFPSQTTELSFDELSLPSSQATVGVPDGGFPVPNACGGAQLRVRLKRIAVGHQGKMIWLPTGTISGSAQTYYCLVQATDGIIASAPDMGNSTVELALTPPTAQIDDNSYADFGPLNSVFWGQAGPRLTQSNLTISYSCYQQKDTASSAVWQGIFDAGSKAAGGLANAGPYGWAFGLGSTVLGAVSGAISSAAAAANDRKMFDVTQTIDKSWLLELTNGHTWSFNRNGGNQAGQYPWSVTLTMESWGCANSTAPVQ